MNPRSTMNPRSATTSTGAEPRVTGPVRAPRPPRRDGLERVVLEARTDAERLVADQTSGRWWTPRGLVANLVHLWRTSLPFRTTLIAVTLTSITVLLIAVVMSNTIARDLYSNRVWESLDESGRAATQARQTFESGIETDQIAVTALREQAMQTAAEASPNAIGYAFYGVPGRSDRTVLQDIASDSVPVGVISDDLRAAVEAQPEGQHYQPIQLSSDGSRAARPGLVVGTSVDVPTAGTYEFYLVYSLESSQATLEFVQRALAISMAVLVLLVAVIVGSIMRTVMRPIRVAAITSHRLAEGHLEERIPERSDDDVGTLARSFNNMADSLQHQIEQLENLSKVQQRFVSDVSHELRTPLTTIRLAGGIIYTRRGEFDPTLARSAELLHGDLLEISRYDAGAVELVRRPGDLVALADDVIGSMTQVAIDHDEQLVLVHGAGPVVAEFDARRIERIVRNLIGNALEHGEGKPVVVRVAGNSAAVSLTVRDYGIGMDSEQQQRAFDRFWRADPSRKRTMGGSGLGLAIAKEDVQLHHGRLELWSAPAKGANFRLTLPRTAGAPVGVAPLPLVPDDAGADGYRVPPGDIAALAFHEPSVDTQQIAVVNVETKGDANDANDAGDAGEQDAQGGAR